jgi:energy-coupling factor transporter transmembrane protein EcfT
MNIGQIIIITIISMIIIISFFGVIFSKKESFRFCFSFLWFLCSTILIFLTVLMTSEREELLREKQKNFSCPQYELIEHNVYHLKK